MDLPCTLGLIAVSSAREFAAYVDGTGNCWIQGFANCSGALHFLYGMETVRFCTVHSLFASLS